ncbi:ABC transporter ATP-binding protein [Pseudonocardia humida]|uniref:ABC transporter ATP-binding protein n=1 Tax=Pseudonocardia humida TaxID=2800819 RepID=A0ABT0ZWM1_9PSEU|nr:ATP-binding cassette domain-containing protein [Pseudonocardia humida]MCO1655148.1 ABC transporter ATP-binding protein [Pseudonocardia humida]
MTRFLRLLALLSPHRTRLALTVACGLLAQGCALGAAATSGALVGSALTGTPPAALVPGVVLLGLCALGQGVGAWLESWFSHDYAFRIIAELRTRLVAALDRLTPAWLLGRRTGDVGAVVMSDVERLEWLYAHVLPQAVVALLVPAGGLVALAVLDPRLALVVAPVAVLLASLPVWLSARARRDGVALRERAGAQQADVVDGIQGLRELLLFGAGARHRDRIADGMRRLLALRLRHGRRAGLENAASEALQAAAVVGVLAGTAALAAADRLPVAAVPLVVVLTGAVIAPIALVAATAGQVGELRGCVERVLAVLDAPPTVVERPGVLEPDGPVEPRVEFRGVTFAYHRGGPDVLRGLDLTVEPGETLALVGASGAGKSTCVALLQRFWDPTAGSVHLGGHDLRDLPLATLHRLVGVVSQDVHLFRGTVADNIRLGRPDATASEVAAAAALAQADGFITALPHGYDTVLAEWGASLSGGQRQRLTIARALLVDPPVLVLDEAAANLDSRTERALQVALAPQRRDRTTLLIAHRLSTVELADRVAVLDGGRVVEIGPPHRLLAAAGPFARLIAAQAADPSTPAPPLVPPPLQETR